MSGRCTLLGFLHYPTGGFGPTGATLSFRQIEHIKLFCFCSHRLSSLACGMWGFLASVLTSVRA